jgi:uncharacterized integral membrane protein (TIGR00698 family)
MSKRDVSSSAREISIVEKALLGVKIGEIPLLLPGLIVVALLAWVGIWLSDYVGITLTGFEKSPISPVMAVIILGLIIGNILPLPKWFNPGFRFAMKKLLRLGIILLGIRMSIFDVFKLGAMGIPIVVLCILGALFFTTFLNRLLKLPERLGTLIAVGTSICGVSAIVAAGPAIDARDEEISYAVAVITIFGLIATLFYPYAANAIFAGNAVKAGMFLGTSVHDTAQVMGSSMVYCDVFSRPHCLDVATVTKMVRNVFMALVIPLMAIYYHHRMSRKGRDTAEHTSIVKLLPVFVIGFLIFAVLRSAGDAYVRAGSDAFGIWDAAAWKSVCSVVKGWSGRFMVVALAGVGLNTRFSMLKGLGIKPFIVGLGAALIVGIVSTITISLLGAFVTL